MMERFPVLIKGQPFFYAGVVELVDAVDSKSTARKGMPVRFRPPAPTLQTIT
jgi:hypothetical protein